MRKEVRAVLVFGGTTRAVAVRAMAGAGVTCPTVLQASCGSCSTLEHATSGDVSQLLVVEDT